MEQSQLSMSSWNGWMRRRYTNLNSNDEAAILRWLQQKGFRFKIFSGSEDHDIGEQEYFSGHVMTNDINKIIAFLDKLYGEWGLDAEYEGAEVRIDKLYPNVCHGIHFRYPEDHEERFVPLFEEFQKKFCSEDIEIRMR